MHKKCLFLMLFFVVTQLNAQPCPETNLKNENLGEVRNQREVSWCYAFSAADLLNYYNPREKISAADIAVNYNRAKLPRAMRFFSSWYNMFFNYRRYQLQHMTGFSKIALNLALKEGSCAEESFPSEVWIKVNNYNGEREEITLDQAMIDIHNLRLKVAWGMDINEIPYYFELPNISRELFYEIVKNYTRDRIFNVLRTYACADSRNEYQERARAKMVFKHRNIMNNIYQRLSNNHPVLVDYDIRLLHENSPRGLKLGKLHTSVLLGSRFNQNKNRCEVLIKDSFGQDCSQYTDDIECDKGYVWVDADKLKKKMTSFVYLSF
jgi:hypothetical protein